MGVRFEWEKFFWSNLAGWRSTSPTMTARKKHPGNPGPATEKKPTAKPARRRRHLIRRLAHSTLFAAGLALAQFGDGKDEVETSLFDPTLVDRLHATTITRHHE